MSDWRVQGHYGFGAARVSLSPAQHRYTDSIGGALRDAGSDFYLSALPPMFMAAFMCAALFLTVSEDRGYTDVEVVMIEREIHGLDEEIAEAPGVVEPEPIKPPEPPPVQKIAEKKPEPPPPVKKVEKVKRVEPPKPPPVQQVAKVKPKPLPKPKAKPKLELAALAPIPKTKTPPAQRRVARKAPAAAMPRMDLVPAIAPALALKQVDEPAAPRRFAAVRQVAPSKPKPAFGVPIAARALTAPPPEAPPVRSRRSSKRAPAAAPRNVAPLDFAAAATSMPAAPARHAPETRRARPVAAVDKPKRAAPPPSITPALTAAAPRELAKAITPATSRTQRDRDRTQRNEGTRRRADHGGRGMQGVPLASLAACLSDREEDALKRRLVAAVKTQSECVSPAGTYRFVETKNLNAFLMTIEHAPGRTMADRCVELSYALDCLER